MEYFLPQRSSTASNHTATILHLVFINSVPDSVTTLTENAWVKEEIVQKLPIWL